MKTVNFAIVGGGLMGREFASAAARWCHLNGNIPRPNIIAVADPNTDALKWFQEKVSSITHCVSDYKDLLKIEEIEAVYCAVPHVMHEKVYCDVINAGKHLFGEKPFGMDKAQNDAIIAAIERNPNVFVRCSSQFPFFPACLELIRWIQGGRLGRVIELRAGFYHSSDLDIAKPNNWKRVIETNGEYGCMGDLGIHTQHVPFRLGFVPKQVYAQLSNHVKERPDGKGGVAPCLTWDNATLVCEAEKDGETIPMILETKRMAPGCTNSWVLEVDGLDTSIKFSSDDPNGFMYTQAVGKEQAWCRINIGSKPQFPTITGSIFEFGFSDAILQMWAAFMTELSGKTAEFGCFRPEETILSHELQTAALQSAQSKSAVSI